MVKPKSKGLEIPKEFEDKGTDLVYTGSEVDDTEISDVGFQPTELAARGFQRYPVTVAVPKRLRMIDYLLGLMGLLFSLVVLGVCIGFIWKIAKWIAS